MFMSMFQVKETRVSNDASIITNLKFGTELGEYSIICKTAELSLMLRIHHSYREKHVHVHGHRVH